MQRLYLQDLLTQENLSPNLALLKLIVTPETIALNQAQQILNSIETEIEFRLKLDLIEAILLNKFPKLTIEEVQKCSISEKLMSPKHVFIRIGRREGSQQGMQQGEANMVIRLLTRRCGKLTSSQIKKLRSLCLDQLDALEDALLDFKHLPDLENWFSSNNLEL